MNITVYLGASEGNDPNNVKGILETFGCTVYFV